MNFTFGDAAISVFFPIAVGATIAVLLHLLRGDE